MIETLTLWSALCVLAVNLLHYLVNWWNKGPVEDPFLVLETITGALLVGCYLLLVGTSGQAVPLTSRGEIFILFSLSMLCVYLITVFVDDLSAMGGMVLPVSLLFLFVGALQPGPISSPGATVPEPERLVSWPHIFFIVGAYGAFSVSFLMAVGYLRSEHQLKEQSVDGMFFLLPSLEALDRGLQRSIWIGIMLLVTGFSVAVSGGLYQGTFSLNWFADPNVLGAIITGLIYGTILFIRTRSLFTNRRISFLAIFGFVFIGVLFVVMNLFPRMHRFL